MTEEQELVERIESTNAEKSAMFEWLRVIALGDSGMERNAAIALQELTDYALPRASEQQGGDADNRRRIRISNLLAIADDETVNNFARSICREAAHHLSPLRQQPEAAFEPIPLDMLLNELGLLDEPDESIATTSSRRPFLASA